MFLSFGFAAIGATDTTGLKERTTADNDAQQRVLTDNPHTSRWSVRKENKGDRKKMVNKQLWKVHRCKNSRDISNLRRVTAFSKENRHPGSKNQKAAWTKLKLKTPYLRALDIAEEIYLDFKSNGKKGIAAILKQESQEILIYDTKRIKDPTFKVDYCLHVFLNLGPAMTSIYNRCLKNQPNRKETEMKLTIDAGHVVNALKGCVDIVKNGGYRLEVAPFTDNNNRKSITPYMRSNFFQYASSPFQRAIKAEVDKTFDSTTYNSQKEKLTAEVLKPEAVKYLEELVNLAGMDNNEDIKKFLLVPKKIRNLARNFRDAVIKTKALADNAETKGALAAHDNLASIEAQFIDAYVANKKQTKPTREQQLNKAVTKVQKQELKKLLNTKNSWVITVSQNNDVTLQWHLSYMADYSRRATSAGFGKNEHTGARYLLGPSNFIRVPGDVQFGYVKGAKDIQSGSSPYYGDSTSMQSILNGKQSTPFTVKQDMKNSQVVKIAERRVKNKELYTMVNIGLGRDPNQPAHLIMGLYSNPELVKSEGQMKAPVLKRIGAKPLSKPKASKPKRKQIGPNTKKNQQVTGGKTPWDEEATINEASPEEVQKFSANARANEEKARKEANERYQAMCREALEKTVKDLKEDLKNMGATIPSSARKADLIEMRRESLPNFELWFKANTTTGHKTPKTTNSSERKGIKTPPLNRRKPTE